MPSAVQVFATRLKALSSRLFSQTAIFFHLIYQLPITISFHNSFQLLSLNYSQSIGQLCTIKPNLLSVLLSNWLAVVLLGLVIRAKSLT